MRKFFRYTIITLFVGFFITGTILQTKTVRNYAKDYIISKIEEETGYTVEIADVRLFPSFQFSASDITLFDNGKKLTNIHHLHFGIYPLAFMRGYLHFHTLHLEGVKVFSSDDKIKSPPSLSIKDIPSKVNIDFLHIHDFVFAEDNNTVTSTPITAKGNFYLSPEESLMVSSIRLRPVKKSDKWIFTEIAYEKGSGSIQINTEDDIDFDAEFIVSQDNLLRINRFHAHYDTFTLDGNATLTFEGVFEDSSVLFSSGELSGKLPIEGFLFGEGKILGSIWSPELDLKLNSDQLMVKETIFRDVQARLYSSRTEEGLGGELSISFLKDDIPYQFSGRIFWDESLGPLPTRFTAKTNLTELTQIFGIETTDIAGNVEVEIEFSDQDISGKGTIRNGKLESYQLGSFITNVEAVIEGNLQRIELKKLTGSDGGEGKFSATGSLDLDFAKHLPFEVNFDINKTQFLQLDNAIATASGKLKLHGNIEKALLEGTITANSARLTIPEKVSAVAESIQITYINQVQGEPPPTPYRVKRPEIPLDFNIKIKVPGNAKIKGTGFTSEWKGEATVTGTPMAPLVNGELTVIKGKYRVRGRNLEINKGSINFAGDLEKKTSLYVIGEMDIDRYTMEIIVKGPIKNPTISFRSNPPLSRKEILSWVLFNKDISDISEFQGGKLNQSITNLSTGTDDGPDVLTRFGDTLGIDRIDISGSPDASQVSFELGKYVSESTYISISRKPTRDGDSKRIGTGTLDPDEYDQSNRIGIETSIGRNFKIQAEVDEDQSGQINLLWKKDY